MPQLLVFTPCERIIVSKSDNSPTLIALFHSLKLNLEGKARPQPDSRFHFPLRWAYYIVWRRVAGEEGRAFEQRVELLSPSNDVLMVQDSRFEMEKPYHRHSGEIFGFPFTANGDHLLRLSLRAEGQSQYEVVADFPMAIQVVFEADSVPASS